MIISRYLCKQILQATAATGFILLVVAVLGRLLKYLAQASQGELDPGVLFLLMSFRLPDFLQLILPVAMLLGILLAYGRMYAESEMTVLKACGMGAGRLLWVTLSAAILVMLLSAFLTLYLTPRGMISASNLLESQKNLNEFDVMVPGLFQHMSGGNRTTYAERIDGDTLYEVFMYEAGTSRIIVSETAKPYEDENGKRFVLFQNGSITEGLEGLGKLDIDSQENVRALTTSESNTTYALTRFSELGVELPPRDLNFAAAVEEQSMLNSELWQQGGAPQLAELQWRISLVLLIPILTLMAVPLSQVSPREGRFARLVPAILLYILYFGLLLLSRDQVADGKLPAWLGLWWVHALFVALGWALFTERLSLNLLKGRRNA